MSNVVRLAIISQVELNKEEIMIMSFRELVKKFIWSGTLAVNTTNRASTLKTDSAEEAAPSINLPKIKQGGIFWKVNAIKREGIGRFFRECRNNEL